MDCIIQGDFTSVFLCCLHSVQMYRRYCAAARHDFMTRECEDIVFPAFSKEFWEYTVFAFTAVVVCVLQGVYPALEKAKSKGRTFA